MDDLISRQEVLNIFDTEWNILQYIKKVKALPSIIPTLYGYDLNHLAFIANVMKKEGLTPEETIEIFRDVGRTFNMVLDEVRESQERYVQSIMGGDQDETCK